VADQFIQVPPQSTGLKIDCTELTVGANTVERERQNIGDPTDAVGLAKVLNAAPTTEYGLVTRNIPSGTQTISGSVTATQGTGTNLHAVIDAGSAVIGHVIADSGSTTAVTGTVAENMTQVAGVTLGATAVTNYGTAPAAAAVPGVNAFITNTPAVTLTSTTVTGTVAENLTQVAGVTLGSTAVTNYGTAPAAPAVAGVNAFITNAPAVTLTSTTVTGTVAENLTQVAGTTLGATGVVNFGTAPAAVAVPGVNASLFIGTTAATAATAGVQLVGIEGRAGTSMETTAGVLDANIKNVGNAAVVTSAAGQLKVGITGNAGATLDSTIGAATAPTNALTTAAVFQTTIPALTAGQAVALQCDTTGSLYTNPEGRRATYGAATGATATAGTGVVLQIQGSATKTVRVTRIHVDGFAATAAQATFKLQRTSVGATAGTSAALTSGKLDTNNAAATAVVTHWTATGGTTGTTVGGPLISDSAWLQSSTFVASTSNEASVEWSFNQFGSAQLCVLRGTADFMTLTCSGTLAASQVWIEWTEE